MDCDKQKENGSCGFYAIAFATAIAHSLNSRELRFDILKMWPHLMKNLSTGVVVPLPTIEIRTQSNCRQK